VHRAIVPIHDARDAGCGACVAPSTNDSPHPWPAIACDPHTRTRPAIPVRRPGDAREVAAAIAHLASPEASYTTGISFVVDGLVLMAAVGNQAAIAT